MTKRNSQAREENQEKAQNTRKIKRRKLTTIVQKFIKKLRPVKKTRTSRRPIFKKKKRVNTDISINSDRGQQLLSQNQQSLSIIISVHNEESTIRQILDSSMQLKPKEIILVENGSTDRTLEICKEYPVRCFSYPNRLGHDVGRALGAKEATGEVLLFLDGDLLLEPSSLLPFVKRCYDGADIVMNNLDPFYKIAVTIDSVSMAKFYLNCLMSRQDLGFSSLTAVPHAMTKRVALAIGLENLAVPPKALAIALFQGMKVDKASTVDVFRTNKYRPYHREVGEMILGDHVEAIHWLQQRTSARVKFSDPHRIRSYSNLRMHVTRGNKKLKIVHAISNAPFAYPIPPVNQGGTEKVFYDLTEELVGQGHEVYVFAPEGSTCSAKVIEYPPDLEEEDIGKFVSSKIPSTIDIINDFTFSSSVKRQKLSIPTLSTHQCALGKFTDTSIYPSERMRNTVGEQKGHIVYNGINPNEYDYNEQKHDYLLFIGRVVREKGILEAIRVAENTNHKLIIAGPVKDETLFEQEIEPLLRNNPNLEYVGPVAGKRKQELFGHAKCVLFPITWEEPFGIVMIEAMATGTPVLAFNQGSVPEVLAGFPQFICKNIEEMMQKVANPDFPPSIVLRQYVINHFSRKTMAENYMKLYRSLIKRKPKKSKSAKVSKPRLKKSSSLKKQPIKSSIRRASRKPRTA